MIVARGRKHPLVGRTKPLRWVIVLAIIISSLVCSAAASAAGPSWLLGSETLPTNLPPGGEGTIVVVASNFGDEPVDVGSAPVLVSDRLPAGLVATGIAGYGRTLAPGKCDIQTISCSFDAGTLSPYEHITIEIAVKVEEPAGAVATLTHEASVEGGGAAKVDRSLGASVSPKAAGFDLAGFELTPLEESGAPATRAGTHPFQLTTVLSLDQTASPREPVALPKDFRFHLPAGLLGNTTAVRQCSMADFFALVEETNLCTPATVVGVATVTAHEPKYARVFTKTVPVFNLAPTQGEPARFGFEVIGKVPIIIDTSVRTGGDYGVDVSVKNATETAGLLSSQVTIWGVPGDPRHNNTRGWECVAGGYFQMQVGKACPESNAGLTETPLLTLPTSCASDAVAEPVSFSFDADSWAKPGFFVNGMYEWMSETGERLAFTGCSELPFASSVDVVPEEHTAATPSGVSVDVRVPQGGLLEAGGRATADVRDTTITLPAGVELSPSAANGLVGCSEAQVGFEGFDSLLHMQRFSPSEAGCPDAAKLGTVHIRTPLLPNELEGALYLADPAPNGEPDENPFGSLVAVYLVAKDPVSGVLVKLAGEGVLDEHTLRVATCFGTRRRSRSKT